MNAKNAHMPSFYMNHVFFICLLSAIFTDFKSIIHNESPRSLYYIEKFAQKKQDAYLLRDLHPTTTPSELRTCCPGTSKSVRPEAALATSLLTM